LSAFKKQKNERPERRQRKERKEEEKKRKKKEEEKKRKKKEEEARDDSFEPTLAVSLSSDSKKTRSGTAEEKDKEKHHSDAEAEAEAEKEEEFTSPPEGTQTRGAAEKRGISSPVITSDVSCSAADSEDVYDSHYLEPDFEAFTPNHRR